MNNRPGLACALACLALVATFCVLNYTEQDTIEESVAEEVEKDKSPIVPGNALKNIINFKSYCSAAHMNLRGFRMLHGVGHQSAKGVILDFLIQFGQEGAWEKDSTAKVGDNIVLEYINLLSAFKKQNPEGVNHYVFSKLNDSILHGHGVIKLTDHGSRDLAMPWGVGAKYGKLAVLDSKRVGFTYNAQFLESLSIEAQLYYTTRAKIEPMCEKADVLAAAMFLQNKEMGRYKSFYQREILHNFAMMKKHFKTVYFASLKAQQESFAKLYEEHRKEIYRQVFVPTGKGRVAAQAAGDKITWIPPTVKEMKAEASKKAAAWLKKYKASLPKPGTVGAKAEVLSKIIKEKEGIKVFLTTGGRYKAESTMKPQIEFYGKDDKPVTGALRGVPASGVSTTQHFKTPHDFGRKIKSVKLTGTNNDPWFCMKAAVRVGPSDADIVKLTAGKANATGFWLKNGETVTLLPDGTEKKAGLLPTDCIKFYATKGCSSSGKHDEHADKLCTSVIQPLQSGHCDCGSGKVASVDCGHDTFKCKDMCSSV